MKKADSHAEQAVPGGLEVGTENCNAHAENVASLYTFFCQQNK